MGTDGGSLDSVVGAAGSGNNGILWKLAILLACLAISAFFSAAETSIISVGKIRVKTLADDGAKNAGILASLHENLEKTLHAVLVGNNIVNITAASIATSIVMGIVSGGLAIGIATAAVTVLIIVFGEITPKTASMRNTERIALAVARPIRAITSALSPVVWLFDKMTASVIFVFGGKQGAPPPTFTEQELMNMVEVSHEEGVLKVEEKQMIHNVFEFGDGEVGEIMTPRIRVASVALDDDYGSVIRMFKENTYSRMPVTKPGTDEIVGIVNLKDIALSDSGGDGFSIADHLRPPHFVYEFNNTAKVFADMRKGRVGMSIVLDEYGVMVGVITTEDFIEEIIGDINDEYDETDESIRPSGDGGNEFIVDGAVGIDNFNDALGTAVVTDDFDSIGGFVLGMLGDFPSEGDKVACEGISFIVESVKNNRIESLRVAIDRQAEGSGADEGGGAAAHEKNTEGGPPETNGEEAGQDSGALSQA